MAKKKYSPNDIQSIDDDWARDESDSEKRGFSGRAVQKFIKDTFNSKMGVVYYNQASSNYLCFASAATRDEYLEDPTRTELILGTFDAPSNYNTLVKLLTPQYNTILSGDKNNHLRFTIDVTDKSGNSTGEMCTITYKITQNGKTTTTKEIAMAGDTIDKLIDDWLSPGTNRIQISVMGNDSSSGGSVTVVYQMIDFTITDNYDMTQVIAPKDGKTILEVPYTASGYGIKYVEWYLDGQKLEYVEEDDRITDTTSSRTKYIDCSACTEGTHSVQYRVYTVVDSNKLYSNTIYLEFICYRKESTETRLAVRGTIPQSVGVLTSNEDFKFYGIDQFIPHVIQWAVYSPKLLSEIPVAIKLGDTVYTTVTTNNETDNSTAIVCTKSSIKNVTFSSDDFNRTIPLVISASSINISEITNGLEYSFDPTGKTNSSKDKTEYTYKDITATLTGFNFDGTSGWIDNQLVFNTGNTLTINYTPLRDDAFSTGKTLEFIIKPTAVFNDNAVICDLRTDGHGILITASDIKVTSESNATIHYEFPQDEYTRMSIVLNRREGSSNKGLMFIYMNGELSAAIPVPASDYIRSSAKMIFTASADAHFSLQRIRVYNTALSSDQILNNYILYQTDASRMSYLYQRNDVLTEDGTQYDKDKLATQTPVMIITGDIPRLEATNNKKEQITVDIEYTNLQDPSRSFTMKSAAMRPQGTSSMSYPKHNFRLYSTKLDETEVYDSEGNLVENRLYSFKDKAQPVDCWCFKRDYAESSSSHNTGIARLWNQVLYDAVIDGEHKLRTKAQEAALKNKYPYDVRTAVDGFPVNLYYRTTVNEELTYMGKYNFNNDKSTEAVFGFRDIPGFNNTNMECWEVLNNGNPIALFTDVSNFDTGWDTAFEGRYPDEYKNVTNLKRFCVWVNSMNGKPEEFATQKWDHLNVYLVAAYYIYLMRFCAVDQTVKNAMLTTEDGNHWYFINYDNDTILGLVNTGNLEAKWNTTRETKGSDGQYIYAGHSSVLWNLLEADTEFINIVSKVDNALYVAGLNKENVIDMFNNKQIGQWCTRIFNHDAQYNYITPYVQSSINNLFMLQGSRSTQRKYFIDKRFALFDSKFVSGALKSSVFEMKLQNDTPAGQTFSITAASEMYYGYGINDLVTESGIYLTNGQSHSFTTPRVLNLGDPVRIYGVTELKKIELGNSIFQRLNQVTISSSSDCKYLEELIIGHNSSDVINNVVTNISGLKKAPNLKTLDITGMTGMTSLELTGLPYVETLYAGGSFCSSIKFDSGCSIRTFVVPEKYSIIDFDNLPNLTWDGITGIKWTQIRSMNIQNCPIMSTKSAIDNWFNAHQTLTSNHAIRMNKIAWIDVDVADLVKYGALKTAGGTLELRGKVELSSEINEAQMNQLLSIYGNHCFEPTSQLYIKLKGNGTILVSGPTSVKEGASYDYNVIVVGTIGEGSVRTVASGLSGVDKFDGNTHVLSLGENNRARTITIRFIWQGESTFQKQITIEVSPITYSAPTLSLISSSSEKYVVQATKATESADRFEVLDWTVDSTLSTYLDVVPDDDRSTCDLNVKTVIPGEKSGVVTCKYKTGYSTSSTVTMNLTIRDENLAFTSSQISDIPNWYSKELIAHDSYINKEECAIITNDDCTDNILKVSGGDYTKLKYFTSITSFAIRFLRTGTIVLPDVDNIITIKLGYNSYTYTNTSLTGNNIKLLMQRNELPKVINAKGTLSIIGGGSDSYKGSITCNTYVIDSNLTSNILKSSLLTINAEHVHVTDEFMNANYPTVMIPIKFTKLLPELTQVGDKVFISEDNKIRVLFGYPNTMYPSRIEGYYYLFAYNTDISGLMVDKIVSPNNIWLEGHTPSSNWYTYCYNEDGTNVQLLDLREWNIEFHSDTYPRLTTESDAENSRIIYSYSGNKYIDFSGFKELIAYGDLSITYNGCYAKVVEFHNTRVLYYMHYTYPATIKAYGTTMNNNIYPLASSTQILGLSSSSQSTLYAPKVFSILSTWIKSKLSSDSVVSFTLPDDDVSTITVTTDAAGWAILDTRDNELAYKFTTNHGLWVPDDCARYNEYLYPLQKGWHGIKFGIFFIKGPANKTITFPALDSNDGDASGSQSDGLLYGSPNQLHTRYELVGNNLERSAHQDCSDGWAGYYVLGDRVDGKPRSDQW